jgi:hypothetical protein
LVRLLPAPAAFFGAATLTAFLPTAGVFAIFDD